jgi:hypothetical protein
MVYAYAAACHLGIQTYREPGWARREAKYAPCKPDLFNTKMADSPHEQSADSYQNNRESSLPRKKISGGKISLSGLRRGS